MRRGSAVRLRDGRPYALRSLRRVGNADLLHTGKPQSLVRAVVRRFVCPWVRLWLPSGGLAVWPGRGSLVSGRPSALAQCAKTIGCVAAHASERLKTNLRSPASPGMLLLRWYRRGLGLRRRNKLDAHHTCAPVRGSSGGGSTTMPGYKTSPSGAMTRLSRTVRRFLLASAWSMCR
jgi:hypothetical protein